MQNRQLPPPEEPLDDPIDRATIENALAYRCPALPTDREFPSSQDYPYRYYAPSLPSWMGIEVSIPQASVHIEGQWLFTTKPLTLQQLADLEVVPGDAQERIRIALVEEIPPRSAFRQFVDTPDVKENTTLSWLIPILLFVTQNGQTLFNVAFFLGMTYLFANLVYSGCVSLWYEPQKGRPLEEVTFPRLCYFLDRVMLIKTRDVITDAANVQRYQRERRERGEKHDLV